MLHFTSESLSLSLSLGPSNRKRRYIIKITLLRANETAKKPLTSFPSSHLSKCSPCVAFLWARQCARQRRDPHCLKADRNGNLHLFCWPRLGTIPNPSLSGPFRTWTCIYMNTNISYSLWLWRWRQDVPVKHQHWPHSSCVETQEQM